MLDFFRLFFILLIGTHANVRVEFLRLVSGNQKLEDKDCATGKEYESCDLSNLNVKKIVNFNSNKNKLGVSLSVQNNPSFEFSSLFVENVAYVGLNLNNIELKKEDFCLNSFDVTTLLELNISGSGLKEFSTDHKCEIYGGLFAQNTVLLKKFTKLSKIDVSRNLLTSFKIENAHSFVNISYNDISLFDSSMLKTSTLTHTKTLDVRGNKNLKIDKNLFRFNLFCDPIYASSFDLSAITLSKDLIQRLPEILPNVMSLSLSGCEINDDDLKIFSKFSKLKILDLSNNKITVLDSFCEGYYYYYYFIRR